MSDSLFSPYWFRAASLHPRLADSVTLTAHEIRGERWYLIADGVTGKQLRVNALGHELVGRLDGKLSMQEIWDALMWRLGNDTPSQHEVLQIVSDLTEAGMLFSEATPYLGPRRARSRSEGSTLSPLSLKVPLFDPTPALNRLTRLSAILFTRTSLVVWLLLMMAAVVTTGLHWQPLQNYAGVHLLTPANLIWSWVLYPLIKLCHEFAHGLAVRRWGGEVHEMGVALFLVVPVPYVDASAASVFPEKHRRMVVSAAGIIVETTIAFVALLVWTAAQDGHVREAAFAAMTISGLSTLLVNANPLMRYDGYHLFVDWLELPNLGARSTAWLRHIGERYIMGNRHAVAPHTRKNEQLWLVVYGVAAALYRLVFFAGLIAWISAKYLLAGAAVALYVLLRGVAIPAWRGLWQVMLGPRFRAVRLRAAGAAACLVIGFWYAIFILPVSQVIRTQGVVWLPDEAHLRSAADATVERVLVPTGEAVSAGQVLAELRSPELEAQRDKLDARILGRESAYSALLFAQPAAAAAIAKELGQLRAERDEVDRMLAALMLRSPHDGVLAWPRDGDMPGRYAARGSTLGEVLPRRPLSVRALVGQDDADLRSHPPQRIEVRIAGDRGRSLRAFIKAQTPAPSFELPSAALGDRADGPFTVDPARADGTRLLHSHYVLDLEVPGAPLDWAGARVWVHLEHRPAPVAQQMARRFKQVFVKQLGTDESKWFGLNPL